MHAGKGILGRNWLFTMDKVLAGSFFVGLVLVGVLLAIFGLAVSLSLIGARFS
jgi:hypothetical protein